MGLFTRARRTAQSSSVRLMPTTGSTFLLKGVTFHQRELSRSGVGPHPVRLIAEENNPHDPQAVAGLIDGRIVGHISRAMAPQYRVAIERFEAAGLEVWVSGTIRRGTGFYVEIDCPFPDEAEWIPRAL